MFFLKVASSHLLTTVFWLASVLIFALLLITGCSSSNDSGTTTTQPDTTTTTTTVLYMGVIGVASVDESGTFLVENLELDHSGFIVASVDSKIIATQAVFPNDTTVTFLSSEPVAAGDRILLSLYYDTDGDGIFDSQKDAVVFDTYNSQDMPLRVFVVVPAPSVTGEGALVIDDQDLSVAGLHVASYDSSESAFIVVTASGDSQMVLGVTQLVKVLNFEDQLVPWAADPSDIATLEAFSQFFNGSDTVLGKLLIDNGDGIPEPSGADLWALDNAGEPVIIEFMFTSVE